MNGRIGCINTPEWRTLVDLAQNVPLLRDLFASDPQRFTDFSLQYDDVLLDYSKQRVTRPVMLAL